MQTIKVGEAIPKGMKCVPLELRNYPGQEQYMHDSWIHVKSKVASDATISSGGVGKWPDGEWLQLFYLRSPGGGPFATFTVKGPNFALFHEVQSSDPVYTAARIVELFSEEAHE